MTTASVLTAPSPAECGATGKTDRASGGRRLLHLMDYIPAGTRTMDHFILAHTRVMSGRGWELTYAFGAEPPAAFAQQLLAAGGSHIVIPYPLAWRSLGRLARALGNRRPDVTLCSFLSAFCYPLWAFKLLGFTRHLVAIDQSSGTLPARRGWRGLLTRCRGRLAGRIVDAVVPVSQTNARRDIERAFLPASKVAVVYNGIRLTGLPAPDRDRRDIVSIAFAGQLIPEKGVHTLLRAFARVKAQATLPLELLIAGRGHQEIALREEAECLGLSGVRFLGQIDSVPKLFAAADIVVIPSEWAEAFGLTIAEAMASGAPCVVSDAGACAEVAGDGGLVFRAGDEVDLAAKLLQLIENPSLRQQLGAAGRARAEACFNLDSTVSQLAHLCEAVAAGEPLERVSRKGNEYLAEVAWENNATNAIRQCDTHW